MLGFRYHVYDNDLSGVAHYQLVLSESDLILHVSDVRFASKSSKRRQRLRFPFYVGYDTRAKADNFVCGAKNVDGVLRYITNRIAHPKYGRSLDP